MANGRRPAPTDLPSLLNWVAEHDGRIEAWWVEQRRLNTRMEETCARREQATQDHATQIVVGLEDKFSALHGALRTQVESTGSKVDDSVRGLAALTGEVRTHNKLVREVIAQPAVPTAGLSRAQLGGAAVGGGGVIYGIIEAVSRLLQ